MNCPSTSETGNTLRFDGEVALVTGAGSGLGRSYAHMLAQRGAFVVVNDIHDTAQNVVSEIVARGGRATAAIGSVCDNQAAIVKRALDEFGRLDILINNAGITGGGRFQDLSRAEWDMMMDIHFGSTIALIKEAWPALASSPAGRILNTSSSSVFGLAWSAHYVCAKAAIFGLTRSLAAEARNDGIRVNCVMPAASSRLTAKIPDPAMVAFFDKHFQPDLVASFATWLLHCRTPVTEETFEVGGGRAARVLLSQAPAVVPGQQATPEIWRDHSTDLIESQPSVALLSMMEDIAHQAEGIGGAAAEDSARVVRAEDWQLPFSNSGGDQPVA